MNRNEKNRRGNVSPENQNKRVISSETRRAYSDRKMPEYPKERQRTAPKDPYDRVRRHRRKKRIFYIVSFLIVVVAAITLSLTVLFRVDQIAIEGETRYSSDQIIESSGLYYGENLFRANGNLAEETIENKLPYIGQVKISKSLPGKLLISVQEDDVAGAAGYNGQYVILSCKGKVLQLSDAVPEGVATIKGLNLTKAVPGETASYETEDEGSLFGQLGEAVEQSGLSNVSAMDLSDRYQLTVTIESKFLLKLGTPTYLQRKLTFAQEILTNHLQGSPSGVIDLSGIQESNQAYVPYDPQQIDDTTSPASSSASTSPSSEASPASATSPSSGSPSQSTASTSKEGSYHIAVDANGNTVYDSDGDPIYTKKDVYTPDPAAGETTK
ncbi:cell division protein FtsQ/DivIB [Caproicibacterium sp. NSD3]